jgi:hypothetical protein
MFESEEKYDEAIVVLSETDWGMKLKELGPAVKTQIFELFGQPPPVKKKPEEKKEEEVKS